MRNPESLGVKDSTGFAIDLSAIFYPTTSQGRGRISPALARKGQSCTILKNEIRTLKILKHEEVTNPRNDSFAPRFFRTQHKDLLQ